MFCLNAIFVQLIRCYISYNNKPVKIRLIIMKLYNDSNFRGEGIHQWSIITNYIIFNIAFFIKRLLYFVIIEQYINFGTIIIRKMFEFGITKIMDGLFISDPSLVMDYQFLITNKVASVVGWSSNPQPLNMDQQGVYSKQFPFCNNNSEEAQFQTKLPKQNQLQQIFDIIEKAKQQQLCSLIYSDYQSEAGLIASTYLMRKFLWDMNTTLNFIQMRFPNFSPRTLLVQELSEYENLLKQKYQMNLKALVFCKDFLSSYKSSNTDQLLLINTIKNTLVNQTQIHQQKKKPYTSKSKKIQWFDRVRPSSSTGNFNKYALYSRGSSLKQNKLPNNSNASVISFSSTLQNNWSLVDQNNRNCRPKQKSVLNSSKHKCVKRSSDATYSLGQYFMDDLQYQSLKQLSRTNFNDSNFKSGLKKRGSLKLTKQNHFKDKINNQNHRPSSGIKCLAKNQKIDSQKFLQNLKSISKQKLGILGINA